MNPQLSPIQQDQLGITERQVEQIKKQLGADGLLIACIKNGEVSYGIAGLCTHQKLAIASDIIDSVQDEI